MPRIGRLGKQKGRPCSGLGIRLVIQPPCQEASHQVIVTMIAVFSMEYRLPWARPLVNGVVENLDLRHPVRQELGLVGSYQNSKGHKLARRLQVDSRHCRFNL